MKHRAAAPDARVTWDDAVLDEPVSTGGRHAAVVTLEEPEPEPGPGPDAAPAERPADTAVGTLEPEELAGAGQESPVLPATVIPSNATWKSRHLGRTVLSIVTAAALMATIPAGVYYWQMRTDERMHLFITVATFAIGLWAILSSRRPQVVTLNGSLLTVRGRRADETFDLADALQRVELSGQPRKLRWSLALARVDKSELVLGPRDVDAIQLDPIVRYYRELAERRRARQWYWLGL